MDMPKTQQQTLFDQALLLDESDSMFSFLDSLVMPGVEAEAAAAPVLYGAAAALGDGALAGAAGDPLAWSGQQPPQAWAGPPSQMWSAAPLPLVKEEADGRALSNSGSAGDRSSGDAAAEQREAASKKSDSTPRSKAERLHLAREKAKQAETEKRVADLASQLEALQHENEVLHRQNLTLQSALVVRSSESALEPAPRRAADSTVSSSGQGVPPWLPWSGRGSVRDMANTLVASVGQRRPQAATAARGSSVQLWSDFKSANRPMAALALTLGEGVERVRLTPEGARGLTLEGFAAIWKELVKRTAAHLVEAAKDPNGAAARQIEGLTREMVGVSAYLAANNPRLLSNFQFQHVGSQTPTAPSQNTALWTSILLSLRFTAEQKAELLRARRSYFMRVSPLLQERGNIQSRLQVFDERLAGSPVEYLQLNELSEALQRNLQGMHLSKCLFMMRAWHQVLTPIQVATFIVHAYPHSPDMMALCAQLAEQEGEPPVSALLRAQAPGGREMAVLGGGAALEAPCSGSIHDVEANGVRAAAPPELGLGLPPELGLPAPRESCSQALIELATSAAPAAAPAGFPAPAMAPPSQNAAVF